MSNHNVGLISINTQVLIRKLQADVSRMLKDYADHPITKEEFTDKITSQFGAIYGEKFDKNLLAFKFEEYTGNLMIQPTNFITALWFQGVSVSHAEISETRYKTKNVTYTWVNDKLIVDTKLLF